MLHKEVKLMTYIDISNIDNNIKEVTICSQYEKKELNLTR